MRLVIAVIDFFGGLIINTCNTLGRFTLFCSHTMTVLMTTRLKIQKFIAQIERIGVGSLAIVLITGASAGAVLAIQMYKGFKQLGSQEFMGPVIALSMTRELGPVLTGLMVTGRVGSSIAAEIGTMSITEQIDALRTLCINPYQYLVVPRVLAGIFILPFLALISMVVGVFGGYLVSVYILEINGEQFLINMRNFIEFSDVLGGLFKASVFGFILTLIGSYKGYTTVGGARGVGIATTQSVVVGSITIIIADYFLTLLLFGPS
jgi:phospholipid/cholesterol/gamma-HCH transport system permease protein